MPSNYLFPSQMLSLSHQLLFSAQCLFYLEEFSVDYELVNV